MFLDKKSQNTTHLACSRGALPFCSQIDPCQLSPRFFTPRRREATTNVKSTNLRKLICPAVVVVVVVAPDVDGVVELRAGEVDGCFGGVASMDGLGLPSIAATAYGLSKRIQVWSRSKNDRRYLLRDAPWLVILLIEPALLRLQHRTPLIALLETDFGVLIIADLPLTHCQTSLSWGLGVGLSIESSLARKVCHIKRTRGVSASVQRAPFSLVPSNS